MMTTGVAVVFTAACATSNPAPRSGYDIAVGTNAPPALPSAVADPSLSDGRVTQSGGPPSLAPIQPGIASMPSARVSVAASNDDLAAVIGRVARQAGLTAIVDPEVHGPVTRTLRDVSLTEAMRTLVGSRYQYQVNNGALIVSPVRLVQHTYTVDYLTMSRFSSASTVVNRGTQGSTTNNSIVSGTTGAGTGVTSSAGGLVASGADVIQSSSTVDVWGELATQLESILFAGAPDSLGNGYNPSTGVVSSARARVRCADDGTCLRISPLTSLVDVTATPEKQDQVARYIGLFTAAIYRQVLIKAQVVEVSLDRQHSMGVDWQAVLSTARATLAASPTSFSPSAASTITGTGNVSLVLGVGDVTLKAVFNALQSVGDVKVVANPQTNAMNQQKASFHVTRQQPFFTITRTQVANAITGVPTTETSTSIQNATVGLIFDVLPQISDQNIVQMAIRPSVSSLVATTTVAGDNGQVQAVLPVIDSRETDTMARVRSGETIMIGGLIQKQIEDTRTGVPILMDIPLIGRAFSKTVTREKSSELVIFLTPEIVSGQPPAGR